MKPGALGRQIDFFVNITSVLGSAIAYQVEYPRQAKETAFLIESNVANVGATRQPV